MALANINDQTGIPYGVIAGNSVPELLEEIMQHGRNLTYEDWKQWLSDNVKRALTDAIADFVLPQSQIARTVEAVHEEVVDLLLESQLNDSYEAEEETFLWNAPDNCRYQVGWLGGAPMIWVLFSPWLTECHRCSPCVPNAGNLDSPCPEGVTCYCVAPEWLPEDTDLKPRALPVSKAETKEVE